LPSSPSARSARLPHGKIDETTELASDDFRNTVPRFNADARKANRAFVDLLARVAERKSATAGTTKPHRLEENIAAADVVLTSEDLDEIDRGASEITPEGARYTESSQTMLDR
jgi:aryl-alcohol dehydrogenase-like predicted oxidoreductase